MLNSIKKTAVLLLMSIICLNASAQLTIVKNGKAKTEIAIVDDNSANNAAAKLLQDFINRITGAVLPLSPTTGKGAHIIIGEQSSEVGEDGFEIVCEKGILHIKTGGDKGSIYGVVTLLEDVLGVKYYAKDFYTLDKRPTITIPALHRSESPAFRYRQTQSYGYEDPIYKMWFRLEEPKELFIGNMWVHTFNRILPSKRFGKEHPEYYSLINGERRPGDHSQWCLTNPDVFEAACTQLDSIFRANPGMKMISVSQNDGNDTYCHCENCMAVDEYEGAHSGNYIRFLNKLAERYPDKEFSTLAYLFTMHPPKHVKPLPNVNIMLCDIDCKREVPLTENASGRQFVEALEGWSRISDNIFVWDYGINFDNTVSPFPNFHILQPNIKLFKDNHVTMHFSQVNGIKGGDFTELRAYMIAKLMWNPCQDADSLMLEFMEGYYGKAAPFMYQYQKLMQGALLCSGVDLWIYDSPISHKDGMLNERMIKTYNELFDKAEAAVSDDAVRLYHVQQSRLTLQYSELEIARTKPGNDRSALLDLFEQRTADFGVQTLNERNNKPADYCKLYRKRFLPQKEKSMAQGAKVTFLLPPEKKYVKLGETAITDGLFGGTTYVESWVGWKGEDASFIIDLGEEKTFRTITTDFLHQLGAWILLPKGGTYSVSTDGTTFTPFGNFEFAEDRDMQVKFVEGKAESSSAVSARYIKVDVKTLGLCPDWHYGVGYEAWFFLDEVGVY